MAPDERALECPLNIVKDSQPGSESSYSESKAPFLAVGSPYKWATFLDFPNVSEMCSPISFCPTFDEAAPPTRHTLLLLCLLDPILGPNTNP